MWLHIFSVVSWFGAVLFFVVIIEATLPKLSPQTNGELVVKMFPRFIGFVEIFSVQTLFSFLELYSKYSGLFHYERTSHGKSHLIAFHHELGPRVNLALMTYIDQVVRNIAGVIPKIEAGNNSFNVSFEEPIP